MSARCWVTVALVAALGSACSASSDDASDGRGTPLAGSGGLGGTGGNGGSGAVSGTGGSGGSASNSGGDGGADDDPRQAIVADDCLPSSDGLTAEQVAALGTGGPADAMRVVYPYDGTVFPRGTQPPSLMWEGPGGMHVRVRIQAALYDYTFCAPLPEDGRIVFPQPVWDTAGKQTRGAMDPYTVSITTLNNGGVASGPIRVKIVIAQATLNGSIYYNSYSSALAPMGGAVLRIPQGGNAELFVGATQCTGCHSVSANGARLIAESSPAAPQLFGGFGGLGGGVVSTTNGPAVYAITPTTQPEPMPLRVPAAYVAFAGLSPDGSVFIANAPQAVTTGSTSAPNALLIETDTGVELPSSGIAPNASMPSFSPDGQHVVYTDVTTTDVVHNQLMRADYDAAQRSFSNPQSVSDVDDGYMGWPFFLPDNQGVIVTRSIGDSSYSGFESGFEQGSGELGLMKASMRTELYVLDVKTKQPIRLDAAMGYDPASSTGDATYLPFGAKELGRTYYPTVSPVAAGGYFWVFFDSVRHYGNDGPQRQLWGTAISISADGTYTTDPSHPAFYLPGQELGTSNHRAFTALDPCHNDGMGCETGIDCCSGFCTDGSCVTPPVDRCANTSEACKDTSDCCDATERCISGFCSKLGPE